MFVDMAACNFKNTVKFFIFLKITNLGDSRLEVLNLLLVTPLALLRLAGDDIGDDLWHVQLPGVLENASNACFENVRLDDHKRLCLIVEAVVIGKLYFALSKMLLRGGFTEQLVTALRKAQTGASIEGRLTADATMG